MMLVPRWCLFVLYVTGCHSHIYKPVRSWNGYEFHTYPHPAKKTVIPRDVMVDVINNLGLKLLAIHNEYNENNIAISPYGAISVLIALGEGLEGDSVYEIQQAAHIPNDISIIRVGLRDIHRHLKSYFIPKEGFLAGLTLNHENVTLRTEYEEILRFYGYDTVSFNNALYPDPETTENPQVTTTTQMTNTRQQTTTDSEGTTEEGTETGVTTDNTVQITTDMATTSLNIGGITELPTTESTITVVPQTVTVAMEPKTMDVTTTTLPTTSEFTTTIKEILSTTRESNDITTTTEKSNVGDTMDRSSTIGEIQNEERTTESSRTTRNIPTPSSIITEPSTITSRRDESTTSIGVTTIIGSTTEEITTNGNILTSTLAETTPQVPTALNIATTLPDNSDITTIAIVTSTVTEPTTHEISKDGDLITLPTRIDNAETTQDNKNAGTTITIATSTLSDPTIEEISTAEDSVTQPMKNDAVDTTQNNVGGTSESTTIVTTNETPDNEATTAQSTTDSTTIALAQNVNTATKADLIETAESTPTTNGASDVDVTTAIAESASITDGTTTIVNEDNAASAVLTTNDFTATSETAAAAITTNAATDIDVTTATADSTPATDTTTMVSNKVNNDNEIDDTSVGAEGFGGTFKRNAQPKDEVEEAHVVQLNVKQTRDYAIHTRTGRSIVDYIIARYYDDQHSNRRSRRPYIPEVQPSFLIYGKYREYNVDFIKYDAVLPFHYVAHLKALALSFPLDSTRYYLLLLLPVDEAGIDKLICDLRLNGSIKYIIENLRYTHVRATIPSFMLKGYVTLTPSFQKLGIRKVFEPRQADFSPMTNQREIYVTNIEQAITVTIRNYMDPNNIEHHRNLHQYDPVNFKADHPFLYFVIDSEIHVTLMAGKIVNPLNSRIS